MLRKLRWPITALGLLFLGSVAFLAWQFPHRPSLTVTTGEPDGVIIGFSPDGHLIATSSDEPLALSNADAPGTYRLWDTSSPSRLQQVPIAEHRTLLLNHLAWNWVEDPGRSWLFWECVTSDKPEDRLRELFPEHAISSEDIDPREDLIRARVSPDGRFSAIRNTHGEYVFYERVTGRALVTTAATRYAPAFGPGRSEATIIERDTESQILSAVRFDLEKGVETHPDRP
jgi:hypothetical protein